MKNLKLFPFERNRYFYGKLLTVRDFEIEQKYNNNKRRLTNMLLHGSGIVCGLQVICVDEKTVSIEPGFAIDGSGREIVVSAPVTQKLSLLQGFAENDSSQVIYLYIAYDEKGKEPVHSIAKADEESEYNRTAEGYRFFIKKAAPAVPPNILYGLFNSAFVLYSDEQIRVTQTVSRYASDEGEFNITVKIDKTPNSPKLAFEYELAGENIEFENGKGLSVRFEETESMDGTEYVLTYAAKIQKGMERGRLYFKDEAIAVKTDYAEQTAAAPYIHEIGRISGSVKEEIVRDYYEKSMDECMASDPDQGLCLARINLIQTGSTFVMDKVIPVPFDEYLPNTELIYRLDKLESKSQRQTLSANSKIRILKDTEKPDVSVKYNGDKGELSFDFGIPETKAPREKITTGTVDLDLGMSPKTGASYFSDEIDHKLGLGTVLITLGLVEKEESSIYALEGYDEMIHFGNMEVFNKSAYESLTACVLLGASAYPKRGTFRIGAKLKSYTKEQKITVRWWAWRKGDDC